jgi:hypothetical protein
MSIHRKYWQYLYKHKKAVFRAGLSIGAPIWRLVIHDWSKFLPSEWIPYARYFNTKGSTPEEQIKINEDFGLAWNLHQKRNKHHWQFWLSVCDSDVPKTKTHRIPEKYLREMVADWVGAGMATRNIKDMSAGFENARKWYLKNKEDIIVHPDSRVRIEQLLDIG